MAAFPLFYRDGGWFGPVGDTFTFATLDRFAAALALHARRNTVGRVRGVVGFDQRFLGERFAEHLAARLEAEGVAVELDLRASPTVALSHAVLARRASFGVMVTARGGPAAWNGLVLRTERGAPPNAARVERLQRLLDAPGPAPADAPSPPPPPDDARPAAAVGLLRLDALTPWLESICRLVSFPALRAAPPARIAIDAHHGVARRLLERLLADTPIEVVALRADPDAWFGGTPPDPWAPGALLPLQRAVRAHDCAWGCAFNGDGSRVAFVDRHGHLLSPSTLLALVAEHLALDRDRRGPLVRSCSTDAVLDAAARALGRRCYEVAPGLVSLATGADAHRAMVAGDHEGHVLVGGHLADSDPFLLVLLLLEHGARTGVPLEGAVADFHRRFWPVHTLHREITGDPDHLRARLEALTDLPPERVGAREVHQVGSGDGLRLLLRDGSWLLLRLEHAATLACLDVGGQSPAIAEQVMRDATEVLLGRPLG